MSLSKDDAMSNMTPSTAKPITSGQIGKFEEIFGAGLRKANLLSNSAQVVLETEADVLVSELVESVRRRVARHDPMIVHHVKVDRSLSPDQVIEATGRKAWCMNDQVLQSMPRGAGEEVSVFFFNVGCHIGDWDLMKEYDLRGLKPADPYSLAKVNEENPAFADTHNNATQWRRDNGVSWCFASFDTGKDGERFVGVRYAPEICSGWTGEWWFAGIRK
jgi:hypothetical protein